MPSGWTHTATEQRGQWHATKTGAAWRRSACRPTTNTRTNVLMQG